MPSTLRFQRPLRLAGDHGVVYRNDREFCGWPFYCGLWKLPDGHIVAGFKKIPSAYGTSGEISHSATIGPTRRTVFCRFNGGGLVRFNHVA